MKKKVLTCPAERQTNIRVMRAENTQIPFRIDLCEYIQTQAMSEPTYFLSVRMHRCLARRAVAR